MEKRKVIKLAKFMSLFLGIMLLALSTVNAMAAPKRGGDFVGSSLDFPAHFNSAIASGAAIAIPASQIFVSLVLINEKWQPMPYLAKSWEISPDGLKYTFHLEKGTIFHDGKPVTSKDVAFSLNVSKNNHPFGPYMFGAVDRVETPDESTVVIRLKQPHPALMIAVSLPFLPILPEHVYGVGDIRKNPANIQAVGSGPFKVVEFNAGQSYVLERFDKFMWPGKPYLDRYIVKKIASPSAALIAISRGEIHSYTEGDPQMVAKLKEQKNLQIIDRGLAGLGSIDYIEFNLRNQYLKDKRVRQAIVYAIDMDFITQKLHQGLTKKATGPIVSASPFYSGKVTKYSLNLEKANQLLDEAGYKRGADGTRFSLNLTYIPSLPYAQKMIAEYMKPELKKIGIEINLKAPADFMSWFTTVAKWEHDMTTSNIFLWGDPVIGIHRLFMSTNIKHQVWTNTSGYVNPTVDQILDKAAVEKDLKKRKALYAEFQKIVADDLPYYFTIEDQFHAAYHKNLRDIPIGIWGGPWDGVYWADGKTP
jgi:peptide/nickel transport system substrate-binding protein